MKPHLRRLSIILILVTLSSILTGCPDAGAGAETEPGATETTGTDTGTDADSDGGTTETPVVTPEPAVYTLSFDGNTADDGDAPASPTEYANGAAIAIPENSGGYEITGYIFGGWNTRADGSGDLYLPGETLTLTETTTLYVRWIRPQQIASGDNLAANYRLGYSTAITGDGEWMVSGMTGYDSQTGSVAFYRHEDDEWTFNSSFVLSSGASNDYLGYNVDIDETGLVAAAGAYGWSGTNNSQGCAAVFVYDSDSGSWSLKQELISDSPSTSGYFGFDIAVSGDGTTIAAGEYRSDRYGTDAGCVHIYTSSDDWENYTHTVITSSTYAASAYIGTSVELNRNGTRLFAGSKPMNRLYIYDSSDSWSSYSENHIDGAHDSEEFGAAVAATPDGNTICVSDTGAFVEGTGGSVDGGEAYLYAYESGSWNQSAVFSAPVPAAGDNFGSAISISDNGNKILFGVRGIDIYQTSGGASFLFELNNDTWHRTDSLLPNTFSFMCLYGTGAALSGDGQIAALGCPNDDTFFTDAGNIYFFTLSE